MNRVVVTGMGVISPIGNNLKIFWENLISGKCGIDFITKFDTTELKVKIAAEVKEFDPLCCMEKNDIRKTDLFAQYAVAAAFEAVNDSGIIGKVDPERFGVYVGSGIGGMSTFITECEKNITLGSKKISPFFIPMMIANMASGNIAIKFNAQGPCLPVVTACATSTHAVGEAFRAIKHGYADAIIAGGAEAAINSLSFGGFTNCMALTARNIPSEASIPFDKRRDGFVMGEGSGILILEEYNHALNRGAKIYAEVSGYGNTCDAYHITAPHPEAVGGANAISLAVNEAGMKEHDGDKIYINAHGTSTPLNDKTETLAIKKVFNDKAYKLAISSTKSMTGHMLGAAGAIESIASIMALRNSIIPPTIGYKEKDEFCDLDYVPNVARNKDIDFAISLSLGFGGHNACVAFNKF
ncbi:MAG: fabF [Clostridia bacterium]|nr:fabF [Clostridia bacterium]